MMTMYVSPYRRVARMREAMNRLLEENMGEVEQVNEREMLLAVDVQAEDEAYVVRALVPGLEADDINVEIINNTVSIRGEFRNLQEEETQYLTCELPAGRFSRVITLPTSLDPGKAEASLRNGVFTLRIPKAEAHRPKVIKVNAG
jgi:HSP20 family protein